MTEPYDLRSNIKGKPGSQGTLFQVKDKSLLNPQMRWPRGYTPERQAEVSDALTGTTIVGGSVAKRTTLEEQMGPHPRYATYPQAEAEVKDTLSRSTVPTEHLERLYHIGSNAKEGQAGAYYPGRGKIELDWKRENRDQRETTLIHEMGHHAAHIENTGQAKVFSHAHELAKHTEDEVDEDAGEYKTISYHASRLDRGVNEAIADNYVEEHFRPHKAAKKRGIQDITDIPGSTYDRRFNPAVLDREYPGYDLERPKPNRNIGPQFHQQEGLF